MRTIALARDLLSGALPAQECPLGGRRDVKGSAVCRTDSSLRFTTLNGMSGTTQFDGLVSVGKVAFGQAWTQEVNQSP